MIDVLLVLNLGVIGYRKHAGKIISFLEKNSEYGKCAYVNNKFIKNLKIKKNVKIAIMFNAADFLKKKI